MVWILPTVLSVISFSIIFRNKRKALLPIIWVVGLYLICNVRQSQQCYNRPAFQKVLPPFSSARALSENTNSDDCYLFKCGSLKVVRKLTKHDPDVFSHHCWLASLNGRYVVVKQPPTYPYNKDAMQIFDFGSHVWSEEHHVSEDSLNALIWPGLVTLQGFSRMQFENIKKGSDLDKNGLWDENELMKFVNSVVEVINNSPSRELFYYRRLSGGELLPTFYGHCERQLIVEYFAQGDLKYFIESKFNEQDRMNFIIWKQIVLDMIQIIDRLQQTSLGLLYHCDLHPSNFGVDDNFRVKMLDIESLFMASTVNAAISNQMCSNSNDLCAVENWKSACNVEENICIQLRTDFNYWALCSQIFYRNGHTYSLIWQRTSLKEHLTVEEYSLLQSLVEQCALSTERADQIVNLIKRLIERL